HEPEQVLVSPGADSLVVVSWMAPGAGTVDLGFRFSSAHLNAGDAAASPDNNGIKWFVDQGTENADSGEYGKFQKSEFRSIKNRKVSAGERIYFIVDPKLSRMRSEEYAFDVTLLDANIRFSPDQNETPNQNETKEQSP